MERLTSYLNEHNVAKLQIGCGAYPLDGWFNTDVSERICNNEIAYMDAGKPFPIPNNSFDYIFSEHLFEHLTYPQAVNMLKECHRVLKKGGVMRLATPNIHFLIDLYLHREKEINNSYIEFDAKRSNLPANPIYAISRFFTSWGHKIIYDPFTLENLLLEFGFDDVHLCEVGKSEHEHLNGIEMHSNSFKKYHADKDYNLLQTMVFEGTK
jgi:predicted SAM-dependent methyltransferase